jgi:hypothetical protein
MVRHWVTRSGMNRVSDSGKESGTVSDKGLGKNSNKEVEQDRMCNTRRFLCFGVNLS